AEGGDADASHHGRGAHGAHAPHKRHPSQPPPAAASLAPPLRVMTYNVRYFGHATRGLASTARAIARIARSIAEMDPTPDLLCLQEVETQSIRATSINRLYYPEETQLDRLMTELTAALRHKKKTETFTA